MKVKELNIFDEYATVKDETVFEAAKIMKKKNVPDLVLIDGEGRPVGIITAVDIVIKVIAKGKEPEKIKISDIARKVKSFNEDALRDEVFEYMMSSNNEMVPITKNDGTLLGVCTIGDVLMGLEEKE